MHSQDEIIRSSGENVIEIIKEHRDDLIEKLSNIEYLRNYLLSEFHLTDLSMVKLEFVLRALSELKATPVDLDHYAMLILDTTKKGSFTVSKNTEHYFRKDIERTVQNYI